MSVAIAALQRLALERDPAASGFVLVGGIGLHRAEHAEVSAELELARHVELGADADEHDRIDALGAATADVHPREFGPAASLDVRSQDEVGEHAYAGGHHRMGRDPIHALSDGLGGRAVEVERELAEKVLVDVERAEHA